MASTAKGRTQEREALAGMDHNAVGRLSPVHGAALVAHPHAVRSALAAAAGAYGEGPGTAGCPRAGAKAFRKRCSSDELAARTGLKTRQSVLDWRRKGRIIGWQNAKRGTFSRTTSSMARTVHSPAWRAWRSHSETATRCGSG